jgi:hypothetical protein
LFWRLRVELAEAVEALLLWDRAAYMEEGGWHVRVQPVFDPRVSPRNCAIIAVRPAM